jgi:arylsulfatase A-like enzyme
VLAIDNKKYLTLSAPTGKEFTMISMLRRVGRTLLLCSLLLVPHEMLAQEPSTTDKPNILFIVLDDVGIDQLTTFRRLGELPLPSPISQTLPHTPNIEAIADAGIKFTHMYTMPECSSTRVAFFTGRFPFRTGVTAALLPEDLPSAQLSPYEVTTPQVLATAGYRSAMIGKYHLGGPDNNPDGYRTPAVAGWDYYVGNFFGGPPYIDTTLGGQYLKKKGEEGYGRYSCGLHLGPERGACWRNDLSKGKSKGPTLDTNNGEGYTGKACATLGGIPALDAAGNLTLSCGPDTDCKIPDFSILNGYYVWPRVEVVNGAVRRTVSRKYITTSETDDSIAWIKEQSKTQSKDGSKGRARPWMLTVSYSSDHIPFQPPPDGLLPPSSPTPEDCADGKDQRVVSDQMIEAMDHEIGRLLVGAGLATRAGDGSLRYSPTATNTLIVIAGDNGSFLPTVKLPYNPSKSKGSIYETGVRAPLVVAGPAVQEPGRAVGHLVSAVDLFQLFGDIAGVDVRSAVPAARELDSAPLLPYLASAHHGAIRSTVFTEIGNGRKPPSLKIPPCVLSLELGPLTKNICTDILLTAEDLCEGVGGRSFGPLGEPPGYDDCCAVKEAGFYDDLSIVPISAQAIRNHRYKLIVNQRQPCDGPPEEFYDFWLHPLTLLDEPPNLLDFPDLMSDNDKTNLAALRAELAALLATEAACPGDGNLDKRVDVKDLVGVRTNRGGPSVFDFNNDGVTDDLDLQIVQENLGRNCLVPPSTS